MEFRHIILLGNYPSIAFGLLRSLKHKYNTYVISDSKNSVYYSKYCKKFLYARDWEDLLRVLKKESLHGGLIIPVTDYYVEFVNFHKAELYQHHMLTSVGEDLQSLMDKYFSPKTLKKLGIKSLTTYFAGSVKLRKGETYIAKPRKSVGYTKDNFIVFSLKDEKHKIVKKLGDDYVVQKFYHNTNLFEVIGYYSNSSGISEFLFLEKELIYPDKFGSTAAGITINPDTQLIMKLKKLFQKIKYEGFFDVEYFRHDGENFVIEINFRPGSPILIAEKLIDNYILSINGKISSVVSQHGLGKRVVHIPFVILSGLQYMKLINLRFLLSNYYMIIDTKDIFSSLVYCWSGAIELFRKMVNFRK